MQHPLHALPDPMTIYPREGDRNLCYLKPVITRPSIEVGEYTFYHDFADPTAFERQNVLYQYPINQDSLRIGKFCSIACGAKFLFNAANHTLTAATTYPFPLFTPALPVTAAWDNKGDIVVGHDVWIGFEAVILAGVTIGNGAIIGTRAVVTKDVAPYTIVGGIPARPIRRRFSEEVIAALQQIAWWDWPPERVARYLPLIQAGDVGALVTVVERI